VKTYDVLIVGGGLAGASLALALKPLGLSLAVVETLSSEARRASPAGDRALALALGSVEIFRKLAVWDKAASKAVPIRHIHVSDRGHFGKTRLHAAELGVEALGYVITARELEQAVSEACEQRSVHFICPAEVTGLTVLGNWVEVRLKSGRETWCCQARLVVAADGGNSRVRQWMGISQQVRDYGQVALVSTVECEKPHRSTAYERFTSSGPLALLPLAKRRCALIWSQETRQARRLKSLSSAEVEAQLQQAFGWKLGALRLTAPLRAFPLRLIRAERLFGERVALVGNAAHQLHPVAGQGFNLGLRDVMVLAELLEERRRQGGDLGAFTLLERYAKARVRDHDRVIGFSDGLIRWFSLATPVSALGRNLGLLALDHLPGLKRRFSYQAMGMDQKLGFP